MDTAPTGLADAFAALARQRDSGAWERIVVVLGGDVHRLCLRLTGEHALAADATQEAFLHLRDGARAFRPAGPGDDAGARRWALRVTANAALMLLRSRRRARQRERFADLQPGGCARPEDDVVRSEEAMALRSALADLPEPLRAVLVLHHLEGLSLADVASSLGVPVGTVKSRLNRGSGSLRRSLERAGIAAGLVVASALAGLPAAEGAPLPAVALIRLLDPAIVPTTAAITGGSIMLGIGLTISAAVVAAAATLPFLASSAAPPPPPPPPPPPVPVVAPPAPAPVMIRGRVSGTVGQVLARLREEGRLDIRDRTWITADLRRLVFLDAGAGLEVSQVLDRMALQVGLVVRKAGNGVLVVERVPMPKPVAERIAAALSQKIDINVSDRQVADVCKEIARQAGIPVEAVADHSTESLAPMSMSVKGMQVRVVLAHVCRLLGLSWSVRDGGIVLFPDPKSGKEVLDVSPESVGLHRHLSLGMAEFIHRALPDAKWSGGPPTGATLPDGAELLTLAAAVGELDEVRALLEGLRKSEGTDPWDLVEDLHRRRQETIATWRTESKRVEEMLDLPLTIEVQQTDLGTLLETMRRSTHANIVANPKLLARDAAISIPAAVHSLREAFAAMTGAGISYRWVNQAFYVTTTEAATAMDHEHPNAEPRPLDLPHRPGAKVEEHIPAPAPPAGPRLDG